MVPNLRHLRAFSFTALHKSVKRAANDVFLSQPAVTQAVCKLEADFGEEFFVRAPDGMHCTAFGEVLRLRVDRALAVLDTIPIESRSATKGDASGGGHLAHLTTAHLRAMIVVADLGCFDAASAELEISKTSLLRTVRNLEHILGSRMFLRSTTTAVLTQDGATFARHAKLAVREIETAREEIEHMRGNKIGRLVIGSMPLARVDLVPKAVTRLLAQYPDLNIRIQEGTYTDLMSGLRSGEIDVVVGALRTPSPYAGVEEHALFSDALSIVVRKGHPLAKRNAVNLSDTIGYPWLVASKGTPSRDHFHAVFRSRALMEPKRILEVSSNVCMRASLIESDRIAMVSRRQIAIEERCGLLEVLPLELPDTSRPIGYSIRQGWVPSRAQSTLINELVVIGRQMAGETAGAPAEDVPARRTRTVPVPVQG